MCRFFSGMRFFLIVVYDMGFFLSGKVMAGKTLDRERVKYLCSERVAEYQRFVSSNLHVLCK